MTEKKESPIELGVVTHPDDTRTKSLSYSQTAVDAVVAVFGTSSENNSDIESDSDSPHKKQKHSTYQMAIGVVLLVQSTLLFLAAVFYKRWYSISPYGSSALVSSFLSGFSQGVLQLINHRKANSANLLKFYVWGVCNGLWTVSFFFFFFLKRCSFC